MPNNWDYSIMTHNAKLAGGPEAMLRNYYHNGYTAGIKATRPEEAFIAIGCIILGTFIRQGLDKLLRCRFESIDIPEEDIAKLEVELAEEPELPTLENLKGRLDGMTKVGCNGTIDQSDMEFIIQYVRLFGFDETDISVISGVQAQPGYAEYAEKFRKVVPEVSEMEIVKGFIDFMTPIEEENDVL